jgi:uncharacterized Tic20 family protein
VIGRNFPIAETGETAISISMEKSDTPTPEQRPVTETKSKSNKPEYTFGMLCHLLALTALVGVPFGNILGPLVIWLIKKEEHPFIDKCGKESLNFQITATLAGLALGLVAVVSTFIAVIPVVGLVSFLVLPLVALAGLALMVAVIAYTIIASIKASEGTQYVYPYSLRLIK